MAGNPLRDAVVAKYGGGDTAPTPTNAPNPLRESIIAKYAAPVAPITTPDNKALVAPKEPAPAEQKTLREQMIAKYSATPATAQAPIQPPVATTTEPTIPKDTSLLSKITDALINIPVNTVKDTWKTYSELPAKLHEDITTGAQAIQSGQALKGTLISGGRSAGDVAIAIFAPISSAIGAVLKETGGQTLVDKTGQVIADKTGITDIPAFQKFAMEHPNAGEDFNRLLTTFMAAGETGKINPKQVAEESKAMAQNLVQQKTVVQAPGKTVFIDPAKIKSIFQTGEGISPQELDLVKQLGLSTKQYADATREGINIAIPAELYTTISDRPWFAKAKEAIGLEPSSKTTITTSGQPYIGAEVRPSRLLPGETAPTPEGGIPAAPEAIKAVQEPLILTERVKETLSKPVTPQLLERVKDFTPEESIAFGRSIVNSINEAFGTKITDSSEFQIPKNVKLVNSASGAPAEYLNGEVRLYVPTFLSDIQTMASGGKISAHGGGEFTTVYEMKPGETIQQLSARYFKDIVLHEIAHQRTMTLADGQKGRALTEAVVAARLKGPDAVIRAQQEITAFKRELEDRANSYLRTNRADLEKEVFAPVTAKAPTKFEKQALGIPEGKKVTAPEKSLLRTKIQAIAKGARIGFAEGKKVGVEQATAEVKSRYETALDRVRSKTESVATKRKELIDYAQLLPFKSRGKFLKAINNTKSDKDFLDVLDRMRKEARTVDRANLQKAIQAELKSTIVKKVGGLPNAKFAYEQQKTLNEIRAAQRMSYQDAQMAIANKVSEWQTANPDAPLPVEILHQIEVLKTAGIKDQSVSELADTLSAIQSIKETGRTKKEIERFNRETEIDRAKGAIFDVITGKQKLPSDTQAIRNRQQKDLSTKEGIKNFLTIHNAGLEELLDMMSRFDKGSKPYESFLSKYVTKQTDPAFSKEFHGEMSSIAKVSEELKKVYGLKSDKEVLVKLGEMKKEYNLGDYKFADGTTKNLTLTKGEALQYHLWMQDPALETTFTEGMGWTPEVMKAIDSVLTPEDMKMGQALLDFYQEYYKGVNESFSKEYGVDLPFNENYSPVHRSIDVSIPENVLLAQEGAKYATAKNGSLKERVKNKIELKPIDAFENLTRHITKMEHFKAWSEPMFNFRRIFADKQIRQAITDFHGPEMLKSFDTILNDIARGGVAREKVVHFLDTLRSNVTKSMLGLNPVVGIKQLTAMTNYGIEIPTGDFFGGMAKFWSNPLQWAKFLHDNSAAFRERFAEGYERDVKFAISKGYDKKLSNATNISEMMFIPIRSADKLTVYAGSTAAFLSKYKELTGDSFAFNKPADESAVLESIRFAEDVTNRVQESSRLDTLSAIQRQGSWGKIFTMFQNQPAKYIRIMTNIVRNYRAGRTDFTTAMHRFMWVWLLTPFLYNLVANQFVNEKYRKTAGGLLTQTLLGPLSYPLIAGQMFQTAFGWASGDRFGYQASPMEAFMNDIQNSIGQFKHKNFGGKEAVKGTTYILDALGKMTGVPTNIALPGAGHVGTGLIRDILK